MPAKTHGKWKTREFNIWQKMKARCYNINDQDYKNYGGRGITICVEWLNNFQRFYDDIGQSPKNSSIDRIDNNGNYCKENCRWANKKQQARNRRNTPFYTYKNETKSISEWAEILNVNYYTLYTRYKRGTMEKLFKRKGY